VEIVLLDAKENGAYPFNLEHAQAA